MIKIANKLFIHAEETLCNFKVEYNASSIKRGKSSNPTDLHPTVYYCKISVDNEDIDSENSLILTANYYG